MNSSEAFPPSPLCCDFFYTLTHAGVHTLSLSKFESLVICFAKGLMACRVLPPSSVHPLAVILLPHNGLLDGGKKLPRRLDEERWSARGDKKDEETGKEMKKSISSRASELSYSCYDLSSLKSFSRSSSSFVVATTFSFILRALGCFYLSNEPLILFFFSCHYFIRSG